MKKAQLFEDCRIRGVVDPYGHEALKCSAGGPFGHQFLKGVQEGRIRHGVRVGVCVRVWVGLAMTLLPFG